MKHYQRGKCGVPTMRLVKHVEAGNFLIILYRISKNLLQRTRLRFGVTQSPIYNGARSGNPLTGAIHSGGVGSIL